MLNHSLNTLLLLCGQFFPLLLLVLLFCLFIHMCHSGFCMLNSLVCFVCMCLHINDWFGCCGNFACIASLNFCTTYTRALLYTNFEFNSNQAWCWLLCLHFHLFLFFFSFFLSSSPQCFAILYFVHVIKRFYHEPTLNVSVCKLNIFFKKGRRRRRTFAKIEQI